MEQPPLGVQLRVLIQINLSILIIRQQKYFLSIDCTPKRTNELNTYLWYNFFCFCPDSSAG